ncbi:MAG: N-acetyltransferase, partial [Alphaproteobacteria bacterium]
MLTTERLTLTPIAATDRDDLALLTGHPEVGGKLKHGVLDGIATDLLLNDYLASWASHGYGVFVMRLR